MGGSKVEANNFLTLHLHWADIVDLLFLHDTSGAQRMTHAAFRVVCIDFTFHRHGEVAGTGPLPLFVARENANHFIPLLEMRS